MQNLPIITEDELEKHVDRGDYWIAIRGYVYDISNYIQTHPGGSIILEGVGRDATEEFDDHHKWVNAKKLLPKQIVGKLEN